MTTTRKPGARTRGMNLYPVRRFEIRGAAMTEEDFSSKRHARKDSSYKCVIWSRW